MRTAPRKRNRLVAQSITGVLAGMLLGAALSASAQVCCVDRDNDGQCGALDQAIDCTSSTPDLPVVCPAGALFCRSVNFTGSTITIAAQIHAGAVHLTATRGDIDLRGSHLFVDRQLVLGSAGNILADPTSSIEATGSGHRLQLRCRAAAITFSGQSITAARSVDFDALQGIIDVGGSTLLATSKILLRSNAGLTAADSVLAAQGSGGRIRIRTAGGDTDLSGAALTASRGVDIDASSQVDQNVSLAAATLRTTRSGNIGVRASGTLDVSGGTLQAAPPGGVQLLFRDPLVGAPASLTGGSTSLVPLGLPPAGPQDTVQLVSDPFTVPANVTHLAFRYLYLTDEVAPDPVHNDTFAVYLTEATGAQNVTTVDTRSHSLRANATGTGFPVPLPSPTGFAFSTGRFRQAMIDVSGLAGGGIPVQLTFSIEDVGDSSGASAVLIDDVVLEDAHGATVVPLGTFESGDLTGFTLSFNTVNDPFAGVIRALGVLHAPEGVNMAILSTGTQPDVLSFVQAVPGNPNALTCPGTGGCTTPSTP